MIMICGSFYAACKYINRHYSLVTGQTFTILSITVYKCQIIGYRKNRTSRIMREIGDGRNLSRLYNLIPTMKPALIDTLQLLTTVKIRQKQFCLSSCVEHIYRTYKGFVVFLYTTSTYLTTSISYITNTA